MNGFILTPVANHEHLQGTPHTNFGEGSRHAAERHESCLDGLPPASRVGQNVCLRQPDPDTSDTRGKEQSS